MYWTYRVVKHIEKDEYTWHSIHEIYYFDDGRIMGWIKEPADTFGETVKELAADLVLFNEALAKPVINVEDLPK